MNFVVVIPARYNSVRLPKKPLLDINGKPMIVHVLRHAYESGANRVIVATDHEEIANVVRIEGGEVCMTSVNHLSGTERLGEVIKKYNFSDEMIIVNVQGDEPMIPAKSIKQIACNLVKYDVDVTTMAVPINNIKEALNSNYVKVVTNVKNHALYFSRSIIPWKQNLSTTDRSVLNYTYLRHLGIYGYYAGFICDYINWQYSPIERVEMLEQLRILWYGRSIHVFVAHGITAVSVDVKEDLKLVCSKLR